MTLSLDEIVFRTRALAQAHPFTPEAQAYLFDIVARERDVQPAEEIAIWAGYAITVGYCLRKLEEVDADGVLEVPTGMPSVPDDPSSVPDDLSSGLDDLSSEIADRIRTDRAQGLLLYPEPLVEAALDRIIAGEVERRLSQGSDQIDRETFESLENYLAWWTLKGYSLRVAELIAPPA